MLLFADDILYTINYIHIFQAYVCMYVKCKAIKYQIRPASDYVFQFSINFRV